MSVLKSVLPILRCPASGKPLHVAGNSLRALGQSYALAEGIPNLVEEEQVADLDALFQKQYDEKTARVYDRLLGTC